MQLDEVLFTTMITEPVKSILRRMEPLQGLVLPAVTIRGTRLRTSVYGPCLVWVFLTVMLAVIIPQIWANVNTMSDVHHYMCDGYRNFVIDQMPGTDVTLLLATDEFDHTLPNSYTVDALEEVVWSVTDVSEARLSYPIDEHWFRLLRVQPLRDSVEWFSTCTDSVTESHISRQIGFMLDLPDGWRCEDVPLEACWDVHNVLLKILCPSRCGCDHPLSAQFLKSSLYGCSESNCRSSDTYRAELDKIRCTNPDVADLQRNENWTQYLLNMRSFGEVAGFDFSAWTDDLFSLGCAALRDADYLSIEDDLSLALWCPEEAGCRVPRTSNDIAVYRGHCPPQCDVWRSNYEESLASLSCVDNTAAEFAGAAGFLELHIDTFSHVGASSGTLLFEGCAGLDTALCGFPRFMRAVCPVTCGCVENPNLFLCRASCALDDDDSASSDGMPATGIGSNASTRRLETTSTLWSENASMSRFWNRSTTLVGNRGNSS